MFIFVFMKKQKQGKGNYLDELNPAQKEAVLESEGPSLIIAGAGSGKTRVLTYRIAHILEQGNQAESILALTFTNKAAREMKERISTLVGDTVARNLWMGTFHSIFCRILRNESGRLGFSQRFSIYDTDDSRSLLKAIIKDMNLDEAQYKVNEVHNRISMAKNNLITPASYASNATIQEQDKAARKKELAAIYSAYNSRLKSSDAMDFDDLLLYTNILFRDHADVQASYAEKFKYILVDEYQDTNYAQYLIVKRLTTENRNLCVVGDDSQSIYSFRGAKIENILNFRKDYPDFRLFKLEQNYRSTKNIVEAANSLIEKNANRIPKTVWSENDAGSNIRVLKATTDAEEGYIIASLVEEYVKNHKMGYSAFSILYRINAHSRTFEEAFRRKGIPYRIYGGVSFYQRKEIKDVTGYFRLIINPNDDEALKRVINYPARGIGKTTMDKLEAIAISGNTSIMALLREPAMLQSSINTGALKRILSFKNLLDGLSAKIAETDAFELAEEIIQKSGIMTDLQSDTSSEGINRKQNVEELLNAIRVFCEDKLEETGISPVTLDQFIDSIALITDADNDSDDSKKERVTLMTVHSAKGLEFDCVFIAGAERELFPFRFNTLSQENIEEERRLFYVALTRAKKHAFISYAERRYKWGTLVSCQPTQFIEEIAPQYLDLPYNINSLSDADSGDNRNKIISENLRPAISFPPSRKKLVHLTEAEHKKNTSASVEPIADLENGMKVMHERFGRGVVISIEGIAPNSKAIINFENSGQKQLLLKFAKLSILPS
jgi:DNA helicase-2/ATP-dependent DNA helicase PcrA